MLNKIDVDKAIKDKINEAIPLELIRTRKGGGNKELSYISGITVIDKLNTIFGIGSWSWTVKQYWIEKGVPFFNKNSKNKDAEDNFGNKGHYDEQGPIAHVLGTLTVNLIDDVHGIITIHKDGFGSKSILGKQNDQESIYKAAATDALKKAASLIGIGSQLYRNDNEQTYFEDMNYENPWTDEMLEKYKEQNDYIEKVLTINNFTDEDYQQLLMDALGTIDLVPDNCMAFYNYLKENYPLPAVVPKEKSRPI